MVSVKSSKYKFQSVRPAISDKDCQLKWWHKTGAGHEEPYRGGDGGAGSVRFRRSERSCDLAGGLFFNTGPRFLLPLFDRCFVAFEGAPDRTLRRPAQLPQNPPNMARVVAHLKLLFDQIGDSLAGPERV